MHTDAARRMLARPVEKVRARSMPDVLWSTPVCIKRTRAPDERHDSPPDLALMKGNRVFRTLVSNAVMVNLERVAGMRLEVVKAGRFAVV